MAITLEQAKNLTYGTILYHVSHKNNDGTPQRWRVSGKPKTWKTRPHDVSIPCKHGLKDWSTFTQRDLGLVSLTEDGARFELPEEVEQEIHDYLMACEGEGIGNLTCVDNVTDWIYSNNKRCHGEVSFDDFEQYWVPAIEVICRSYGVYE